MMDSNLPMKPHQYRKAYEEVTDRSKSKEEITAVYDKWTNYEEDVKLYAPNRPIVGAKAFEAQYGKNKDIKILDAGAGTGLAAEGLMKLGFHNFDMLEPSETLAKQALAKNLYKKWYKAYMCKDRLPIDDDTYDVVYALGAFGPGCAKEDCLEELIRILKPGGQVMIVMHESYLKYPDMSNFETGIAELEKAGILRMCKRDIVPNYKFGDNGPMNGLVIILEKPKK